MTSLAQRYAAWVGDRYGPIATPDALAFASVDGWRLAVRRHGSGPAVVLCHGLGGNHASFELAEQRGLARWLASRGFAVHVVALRGTLGSEPSPARHARIGLQEWACRDVPALLDVVCRLAGESSVAWVGHSLGALLPILAGDRRVRRLVALGPPLDLPRTSARSSLRTARWLARVLTGGRALPMRRMGRLEAPLMGRFSWPRPLAFVSPPNLEGAVSRALHAHATEDLPGGVIEDLDAWCAGQGSAWDARVGAALRAWRAPTTCIVGDEDRWAPPGVIAERLVTHLPHARMIALGRLNGQRGGYDHIELIAGPHAAAEVFPLLAAALHAA